MPEIKFTGVIRKQGNSYAITIPKEIGLEIEKAYQFSVITDPIQEVKQ